MGQYSRQAQRTIRKVDGEMKNNFKYLWYVLCHKWFVFVECWRMHIVWEGIVHDFSKFLPSEWYPYVNHFYGPKAEDPRDETGYYKPTDTGDAAFDFAWLLHQKRNRHHWQWWILPEDEGGMKVLPMDFYALREMLCDWCGASKAQRHGGWAGVRVWYDKHASKMTLHSTTRCTVELLLEEFEGV